MKTITILIALLFLMLSLVFYAAFASIIGALLIFVLIVLPTLGFSLSTIHDLEGEHIDVSRV